MALSFRPGFTYVAEFDHKLARWLRQGRCPCHGRVRLSTQLHKVITCALVGSSDQTLTVWQIASVAKAYADSDGAKKFWEPLTSFRALSTTTRATFEAATSSVEIPVSEANQRGSLNEEQVAVVEADAPYVRVVVGPGSGKTRVLTHRIAHMISNLKVLPSTILAVAAFDMGNISFGGNMNGNEHLERNSGQNVEAQVIQGAQALALKDILQCEGFPEGTAETLGLLQFLEKHKKRKPAGKRRTSITLDIAKELLRIIKRARLHNMQVFIAEKNGRLLPNIPHSLDAFAFKMAEIYEIELQQFGAADFDDLLYLATRLLHNNPHVLKVYREKWRHALVDEFQDIDGIQYELIRLLSIGNDSLFVVGDIDQEIKVVLAYLQLAVNCENEQALEWVINTTPREIPLLEFLENVLCVAYRERRLYYFSRRRRISIARNERRLLIFVKRSRQPVSTQVQCLLITGDLC